MKTGLIAVALTCAVFYCAAVGILAWQQRRLLYFPDRSRPDLAAAGVAGARTLTVHTADGLDLLAWYLPAADDAQPVVLYLHGNAGNIADRADRCARFARFGWGVLLLEIAAMAAIPARRPRPACTRTPRPATPRFGRSG
jgi:uncharacterized protein